MPQMKPNKESLSIEEMALMQENTKSSKIYKEISSEHRQQAISKICLRLRGELENMNYVELTTIPLDDLKAITDDYITACGVTGSIPSVLGLARYLGYSRGGLYKFLNTHAHTENAKFLEIVRDALAQILDECALQNVTNPVVSIFILKSLHERIDKSELFLKQEVPESPLGIPLNDSQIENLKRRYLSAAPEDCE